eukprot:jgi/Mesvir1/3495/Mv11982-RA.2
MASLARRVASNEGRLSAASESSRVQRTTTVDLKNVLCPAFAKTGSCPNGNRCKCYHPRGRWKQPCEVCIYALQGVRCKHGDNCRYLHPPTSSTQATRPAAAAASKLASWPSTAPSVPKSISLVPANPECLPTPPPILLADFMPTRTFGRPCVDTNGAAMLAGGNQSVATAATTTIIINNNSNNKINNNNSNNNSNSVNNNNCNAVAINARARDIHHIGHNPDGSWGTSADARFAASTAALASNDVPAWPLPQVTLGASAVACNPLPAAGAHLPGRRMNGAVGPHNRLGVTGVKADEDRRESCQGDDDTPKDMARAVNQGGDYRLMCNSDGDVSCSGDHPNHLDKGAGAADGVGADVIVGSASVGTDVIAGSESDDQEFARLLQALVGPDDDGGDNAGVAMIGASTGAADTRSANARQLPVPFIMRQVCPSCHMECLDPHDKAQRYQHISSCIVNSLVANSSELICPICHEKTMEKRDSRDCLFAVLSCDHHACASCTRKWRETRACDVSTTRGCVVCRAVTHLVLPSPVFVTAPEHKASLAAAYMKKLSTIPCKYPSRGEVCPFLDHCLYKHEPAVERSQPLFVEVEEGEELDPTRYVKSP